MEQTIEIPVETIAESKTASLAVMSVASSLGLTPSEAIVRLCKAMGKQNEQKEQTNE